MRTNLLRKLYLIGIFMLSYLIAYAQEVKTHTVQPGETLARIAQMYGVSESDLLEANPTAKDYFYTGLKLVIPTGKTDNGTQIQQNAVTYNGTDNEVAMEDTSVRKYDAPIVDSNLLLYGPDSKMWGFTYRMTAEWFPYMTGGISIYNNLKFGKNNFNSGLLVFDIGLSLAKVVDDSILLQANLLPYAGIAMYEYADGFYKNGNVKKEMKTKFTYGAKLDLQVGVKIFTKKNGKDVYLTGGYQIWASEFHTEGMFKAGNVMLGISFVE